MKRAIFAAGLVFFSLVSWVGVKAQDAEALEAQYKTCAKHDIPADKCTPEIYKQLKDKENAPLEHNVAPSLSGVQERWTRTEKTDALRGTTSTRFTLEGKFLEAPQQSKISSPTFVVDCVPGGGRKQHGHTVGKLLDAYIIVGGVLDTGWGRGVGIGVQYRLDDGKVKSDLWSHSTDWSAIFLASTPVSGFVNCGLFGCGGASDAILGQMLYSHKAYRKDRISVPARKAVIQVSEYLGGNITMEFDYPDPTEVADACGLFQYWK